MAEALAGDPRRILVIKLADLGDLLTATPTLRALRNRFPSAEITALVTPHTAGLLIGNDAVDHVRTFPKAWVDQPWSLLNPLRLGAALAKAARLALHLRGDHFDTVVLLHHLMTAAGAMKYRALLAATGAPVRIGLGGRPGLLTASVPDLGFGARHEVEHWLEVVKILGAQNDAPRMELHLTEAEQAEGDRWWADRNLAPERTAVLHPGSGAFSLARRWAPERFAAVGDALARDGLQVVINAGPGEDSVAAAVAGAMSAPAILLQGLESPRKLAAVLRGARVFVGNDSGVMHIAATMGVPTVGVFGLTNHRAWGPYPPEEHRVVRLDLPCSPCAYVGHGLGTPDGCPARTCLVELGPDPVIAATRELLGATSGRRDTWTEVERRPGALEGTGDGA